MWSHEIGKRLLSLSDADALIDQNKQTTSLNNKRYYLVNLLQFFVPHLSPAPEPANKSHEKATLNRLASQPCFLWCKPADLSRISSASQPPTF